jgi:hypothetical protein
MGIVLAIDLLIQKGLLRSVNTPRLCRSGVVRTVGRSSQDQGSPNVEHLLLGTIATFEHTDYVPTTCELNDSAKRSNHLSLAPNTGSKMKSWSEASTI